MKKLVLLRHGESEWNQDNRFTGWTDVELSEKGVDEAREAGRVMKLAGLHFDVAYTSYLKRAIKTLWLALEEMDLMWIPVHKSWRLNEKHYGNLQGMDKKETADKYGADQVLLWRRSFDVAPAPIPEGDERRAENELKYRELSKDEIPETESLKETIARILPYWKNEILVSVKTKSDILITAHGNSLRSIVKELKGLTEEEIIQLNLPTGIPYVFEFNDHMELLKDYFIGDEEEIRKLMQKVANQAK